MISFDRTFESRKETVNFICRSHLLDKRESLVFPMAQAIYEMTQIPRQQNGYIQCDAFSHREVLQSPENAQSTTTFNDMTGFHKILLSERGQTQKSVPCTQSPQIAKVICAIRSQHVISVGLGSDSEGVREGPSLDYVGGFHLLTWLLWLFNC